MAKRVALFVDYQNVYRRARGVFHDHETAPHWAGQIYPDALGRLIVRMSHGSDRVLDQVRVYRGLPDSSRDPKGYGAASRQIAAWRKLPLVEVTTRPFRYPSDYPASKAQEKGIDVQMALDFAVIVEVAAWRPPTGRPYRLRLPNVAIWCHLIGRDDYADHPGRHRLHASPSAVARQRSRVAQPISRQKGRPSGESVRRRCAG